MKWRVSCKRLLNPLPVRPSYARMPINPNPHPVRPVRHLPALFTPRLPFSAHPLVCMSISLLRGLPSASYPPPVRLFFAPCLPLSARPPYPHFQKITYEFVLLESYLPSVRHVNSPRLQFMAPVGATMASDK